MADVKAPLFKADGKKSGDIVEVLPLVINFFSGWAPQVLVETIASFSFLANFTDMTRGVIDVRHVVYFASLTAVWLFANVIAVDQTKGA